MKKITYNQAKEKFSNYLYTEQKAPSTQKAYLSDMKIFEKFLKVKLKNKIRYLNDLTGCEIQQFKEFLLSQPYKFTTIARKYNTLKVFFRYLSTFYGIKNILPSDSWGSKKQVKENKMRSGQDILPATLQSSDIDVLLNCIASSTDKLKYRDTAIFMMLLTTGARRSDILSLKWSDVNFYRDELKLLHIKTVSGGIVTLPFPLKGALLDLNSISSLSNEYVFMSRQGTPLSKSAFNTLFRKWISKSDLQQNYSFTITPHICRHTFITECIRQDVNTEKIIEYTGHKDSASLAYYKHLVPKDHAPIANLYADKFTHLYTR